MARRPTRSDGGTARERSESDESADDGPRGNGDGNRRSDDRERADGEEFSYWFANSAAQVALVVVGLVITIFALGQAVGIDLLGMFAAALSSETGQWLLVALVGILLIVVAQRALPTRQ